MEFYEWLIVQGRSPKTAKNYSGPLSGKFSGHTALIEDPQFDHDQLKSDILFKKYCEENDESGDLYQLNKRGKDMYRRALVMYSEYVMSSAKSEVITSFELRILESINGADKDRKKRLEHAERKPCKTTMTIEVYERNPDVVAEVLLRANGECECCNRPAPFYRKSDGTPYLEVHHRTPLAKGGDDLVDNAEALCPNCHREKHYGL